MGYEPIIICVSFSQDAMIQKVTIPVTYVYQVHSLIFETDPVKRKRFAQCANHFKKLLLVDASCR